ncbi:MAG: hypothetical protein NVSMB13_17780 [Mycobacteriales bacterium]
MLPAALSLLLAACSGTPAPVPVAVPTAGGPAADAACARLTAALPTLLVKGVERRSVQPPSTRTAAWGTRPVVLRCGVDRPEGYRAGVEPVEVNGVAWYQHLAGSVVEWTAVDRPLYLELTVPATYADQGSFLVELAAPVSRVFAQVPQAPAPAAR